MGLDEFVWIENGPRIGEQVMDKLIELDEADIIGYSCTPRIIVYCDPNVYEMTHDRGVVEYQQIMHFAETYES